MLEADFSTTDRKAMKSFITLFLLLISVPAFAQITLTSDQFLQTGGAASDSYSGSTKSPQSLINMTGANQSWDFSGLGFTTKSTGKAAHIAVYPAGAANEGDFPTATHVSIDTAQPGMIHFTFIKINSSGLYLLGASQDSLGTKRVVQTYTPAYEVYPFPMTYQSAWSSTSTVSPLGAVQEVTGLVDGWGTLLIPGSNTYPCLRVKIKQKISLTYMGFGYSITNYTFNFLTAGLASASIAADSTQKATANGTSFAVPVGTHTGIQQSVASNNSIDAFGMRLGSNPVSATTTLFFTMPSAASVRVTLMDVLGRESRLLLNGVAHTGENTLTVDPATLANGTYFLRVESLGYTATQKLIIAR